MKLHQKEGGPNPDWCPGVQVGHGGPFLRKICLRFPPALGTNAVRIPLGGTSVVSREFELCDQGRECSRSETQDGSIRYPIARATSLWWGGKKRVGGGWGALTETEIHLSFMCRLNIMNIWNFFSGANNY